MQKMIPLEPGGYYHVYDRGVNRENIFREELNYKYFLSLYAKYITPIAETFAYCLLRNHFHLLVRIRSSIKIDAVSETASISNSENASISNSENASLSNSENASLLTFETASIPQSASVLVTPALASKAFNNLLTAYAKAMNKAYGRTGALFQHHFGRIPIASDRYFATLVRYIHLNPRKHGFVSDFRDWPHSSYHILLSDEPTPLARAMVLDWFGGARGIKNLHVTGGETHNFGKWEVDDPD